MFVLMSLMYPCLRRAQALALGAHQSLALIQRMLCTAESVAYCHPNPLAYLHAPIPKLTV